MLNKFFNWLDPKIINMEKWIHQKVVEPDKIDVDLDKIKKGQHKATEMFYKSAPHNQSNLDEKYGPFIANLEGAKLMSLMYGPGETEAFSLLDFKGNLWWRHRDGGTTHDFRVMAFDDMQEFTEFIGMDTNFWECVLRSEARFADLKTAFRPPLKISDVKKFIKDQEGTGE